MFQDRSHLLLKNVERSSYGIAACDIDRDGTCELFVTGFGEANRVLKWNGRGLVDIADPILADIEGKAIAVAAADIDGDGEEEIYVLNASALVGDRLFDFQDGQWVDLRSLGQNQNAPNTAAGHSVICLDRFGNGNYGFLVVGDGIPIRLYELDRLGRLTDVAAKANLNVVVRGRSAVAVPIFSNRMDVFVAVEDGANLLFRNRGDGTFEELADTAGLSDLDENGRGIAVLDADGDGKFDLAYGNWEGQHRLFLQGMTGHFRNVAPSDLARSSRIRTAIAADFDNDGCEELFFNNVGEPNRLFGLREGSWRQLDIGDAWEPDGWGTGAVVGDFDGDGCLELLVAHGESRSQPLSLYRADIAAERSWLRVLPLTASGAPARGAICILRVGSHDRMRAIDAGSGYWCQMEPIAHFGLDKMPRADRLTVHWSDGTTVAIDNPTANQLLRVPYPGS